MHDQASSYVDLFSGASYKPSTLIDLLRWRALLQPDQLAYCFLIDGEIEDSNFTYEELDRRARSIAATLQCLGASRQRALLLYPPGLDFIAGFFGCLYAGVVAVPAYPPDPARLNRTLPRLQAIIADAQATVALTTTPIQAMVKLLFAQAPDLEALNWLGTDALAGNEDDWQQPGVSSDDLAFLQYTSGSTGAPRGVKLTQANLLHNAGMVFSALEHAPEDKYVSWLPTFHDMGFMAGVLQPLYAGLPVVLMPPASFLQRPIRWLRAISHYRATTSGGPNFAYDLCARKITAEEKAALDLSSWTVAFNGAEPVRAETLYRFAAAFESCGFRLEAFYPCYGLAEATLIVSGGLKTCLPITKSVNATELENNRVVEAPVSEANSKTLVGCGSTLRDQRIIIVDPESLTECPPDQVGEIWVSGPSVAEGYWNRPAKTEQTFMAFLSDAGDGPFLRTGDLGFLDDGELYITGRLKDLIIIRGLNHYPQDIELTVERCHAALRPGCGAAFSVEAFGEERLVIVHEIDTRKELDFNSVIESIREAIAYAHELQVHAVMLIKPGSIPKTSSGKIQRLSCRLGFIERSLHVVAGWHATEERDSTDLPNPLPNAEAIQSWLASQLAARLGVDSDSIDLNQPIARYGLDSLMAIELAHGVEANLGISLPIVSFLQGSSIAQIAAHPTSQLGDGSKLQTTLPIRRKQEIEYALTHGQRGLWFLQQLAPESTAYHIARAVRIRSDLDVAALRCAFQALVDRHACLRTTFFAHQGEPFQRIHKNTEVCFYQEDARDWSEARLNDHLVEEANRLFDLERGPLLRVHLFVRSETEHVLLLSVHHIIVDFWSLAVMMHELGILYQAEKSRNSALLSPLALQYCDFVRWQARLLSSEEGERLWAYWRDQLSGELPTLNLPTGRRRPLTQSFRSASHPFRLSKELTERLKAISYNYDATLYMTLLAALQIFLHRYTGQDDILVGSVTAGRTRTELEPLVGYFANPVVLRAKLSNNYTFRSLLAQVRQRVLEALDHQDYPFSLLVERLQPARDPARSPLFQVMFSFQKMHLLNDEGLSLFALGEAGAQMNLAGLELESMALKRRASQFELTLMMAESDRGLTATFEYDSDLFDDATIRRMTQHFQTLLEGIAASPDERISRLPLLSPAEVGLLIEKCNDSQTRFSDRHTIHSLFEQQVERAPQAVALIFEHQRLSYEQLNKRANQLAYHLIKLGAGPDVLVGICLERSFDMIISLLAVLKAGGAYVPLDPSYPKQRLSFLLDDSKMKALLTQRSLMGHLPEHDMPTVCLDGDWEFITQGRPDNPVINIDSGNAAYVIYTSGSTGKPKGVVVTHNNVTRLFLATEQRFGFTDQDVWTLFHSYAFDFSVWEMWGALLHGGRLVIVPYWTSRSPDAFYQLLCSEEVTVLNQTPSAFRQLAQAEQRCSRGQQLALRCVVFGGEALELQSLKPWIDRHGEEKPQLINMYGITETTVHVSYRRISHSDLEEVTGSVIGSPISDLQIYVLDEQQQIVPTGVAGELCVAGDGLTRGYLNRPDLTAERFIPNPFSKRSGERMYRSGDLGGYLPEGEVEYLGRADQQVKIRGYRVELGEIEAVLSKHPSVRESVLVAREIEAGERRLVGYAVMKQDEEVGGEALRVYLREKLPEYMVPAAIVMLDELPLTLHGKIDHGSLPAPDWSLTDHTSSYAAPQSGVEQMLAQVWADVLGIQQVGIHDNFFELGGDSILSIQVIAKARERGLEITPRQLFQYQTIAELAPLAGAALQGGTHAQSEFELVRLDESQLEIIERSGGPVEDIYPLSWTQQGMLFHSLCEPLTGVYCTQLACELKGDLHISAFEAAWQDIADRHEALRTGFEWEGLESPLQIVRRGVKLKLNVQDWRGLDSQEQDAKLEEYLEKDREKGFDLSQAPLMRLALIRMAEREYQLVWSSHHLLIDGWSLPIILDEVFALYDAHRRGQGLVPSKAPPYKEYIAWLLQQDYCSAEAFWREYLKGFTSPTRLGAGTCHVGPTDENHHYGEEFIRLPVACTAALQSTAHRYQLTLNTLVQGVYALLLSRYSGEEDVVFGVTLSGRPASLRDAESRVGLFINTLPFRVQVSPERPLISWLRGSQDGLAEVRQYEYSSLAQVQKWSEVPGGESLFESMFVFENYPVDHSFLERRSGLQITNIRSIEQTNYPLTIAAVPGPELALHIGYEACRFDVSMIRRMLGQMQTLLESIAANPDRRIRDLPLLTESEKKQQIIEWNDNRKDYPANICLHELFQSQAQKTPDAVALIGEHEQLTYEQLNRRANRLAHYLQVRGAGPGTCVGLCLERGLDSIVALLAILKSGSAYLPLDPDYPKQRLSFMLDDSQAKLLVTQKRILERVPRCAAKEIYLDTEGEIISQQSCENLVNTSTADDLAYVIYTSGSTGRPKGVMVDHRSACNHMMWMADEFQLSKSDRVLQKYSVSFDASLAEIFYPIISGASLVIARHGEQYDISYLVELICEHQVTVIDVVPTMLKALIDYGVEDCTSLRRITSGGESLPLELKQRVYERLPGVELANLYGPTEATITATYYRCGQEQPHRSVPIGKPIANTQVYILDIWLDPVPVGMTGEIHIGGEAVAWGYLNCLELTAEKFIPDPFNKRSGARLYRTGDLARYLDDGSIDYIGRADQQVKLRGFRVELGELESSLKKHAAVKQVAVVSQEDDIGRKRLVAYVVLNEARSAAISELRAYLKEELPIHMVPAAIVILEEMPLTASGKIDWQALPSTEVAGPASETGYVAPQSEEEKKLVRIWEEMLRVRRVGVKENFFELGGDSILSIQIAARAREAGLKITPKHLFQHQTISELALAAKSSLGFAAEQETLDGLIPLTPIQNWFFEQELPEPHHYNQAVMLEVKPDVTAGSLERILKNLIEHHDALRLRFKQKPDGWEQYYAASEKHEVFNCVDLRDLPQQERSTQAEKIANKAQASLDLIEGPVVRAVYFSLGLQESRLLLVVHHLAIDGVSWRILLDDLHRAYKQLQRGEEIRLSHKTLSFKRWAELLAEHAQTDTVRQELDYWTAESRKQSDKLPVDYQNGGNTVDCVQSVSVSLNVEETRRLLRESPAAYHTQINDVLLTALTLSFSEWTGNRKLLVDLEGHGREEVARGVDISRTVGWFTSIFPVLLEPASTSDLAEALKSVKEQLRRIPNRGIGYGLLRYLSTDRSAAEQLKKLPQAEISFNYLGQLDQTFDEPSLFALASEPAGQPRSKLGTRTHLIEIDASVKGGRLEMEWAYSEQAHSKATIEGLAGTFIHTLRKLIDRCAFVEEENQTLSDFPLAKLDQRKLEELEQADGKIEDIYPLSPMQQGMLFHSLFQPQSNIYCTQLVCELKGKLDHSTFQAAWQSVLDRHPVLRTTFEWEGVEEPLQIVRRGVRMSLDWRDWRGLEQQEQETRLQEYLRNDRGKGFDLRQAPLMRLAVMRVSEDKYQFVWSSHHLLIDGWSLPHILKEMFTLYEGLCRKEQAQIEHRRPYRDYIAWLRRQDLSKAEAFWRRLLKGFASPTPLAFDQVRDNATSNAEVYGEQEIRLTESVTASLQALARQHQLTVNTIAQGGWALLLSAYSGNEDVVFGVVVSGRSSEIAGIESMIGLFINTLPVRARVLPDADLFSWLKQLQEQQAELHEYEYSPLAQVQAWSDVPPGAHLFESLFVFENYPIDAEAEYRLREPTAGFRVGSIRSDERSNYPLTVWALPGRQFSLRMGYDRSRFSDATIKRLLTEYKDLLQEVASNPQQLISESTQLIEGRKRAASNSKGTNTGRKAGTAYVAPRNSVEEAIARMWCEALGLERVGINDNFFELGGRPLAATQILHRVRNMLQVSLPLSTFFETPTVAALSEAVLAREKIPGRAEKIARIMNRIESMSAEDMKDAIHDKERQKGSHEGNEPAPR